MMLSMDALDFFWLLLVIFNGIMLVLEFLNWRQILSDRFILQMFASETAQEPEEKPVGRRYRVACYLAFCVLGALSLSDTAI
jgi:hypothetical protein